MAGLINDPDMFARLLSGARSMAFRLEVRSAYGVPEEDEPFQHFLADEDPGAEWLRPWLDLVRGTTGRGVRVERVRVVDEPPSDYQRFELSMTHLNLEAGEDIRYLTRTVARDLRLPAVDYWLIDKSCAYILRFADDDQFLGLEPVADQTTIDEYVRQRDRAWAHAEPAQLSARRTMRTYGRGR